MDLRFNKNLFNLLIMPNVRMIGSVYQEGSQREREKVQACFKKMFRSFCLLPWSTPHLTLEKIIGNVDDILINLSRAVDHKSISRHCRVGRDAGYLYHLKGKQQTRFLPPQLTKLLRVMYGRKCNEHD